MFKWFKSIFCKSKEEVRTISGNVAEIWLSSVELDEQVSGFLKCQVKNERMKNYQCVSDFIKNHPTECLIPEWSSPKNVNLSEDLIKFSRIFEKRHCKSNDLNFDYFIENLTVADEAQ